MHKVCLSYISLSRFSSDCALSTETVRPSRPHKEQRTMSAEEAALARSAALRRCTVRCGGGSARCPRPSPSRSLLPMFWNELATGRTSRRCRRCTRTRPGGRGGGDGPSWWTPRLTQQAPGTTTTRRRSGRAGSRPPAPAPSSDSPPSTTGDAGRPPKAPERNAAESLASPQPDDADAAAAPGLAPARRRRRDERKRRPLYRAALLDSATLTMPRASPTSTLSS